ncbi:unnamed protein product [Prorocentrum cordatum]|uniref:Nucleoporin Nup133/Nup155-like N-terminal domain-containing protein n=1 Tax=Prorocentrum cordatum TaxID=2364126 RepID=A0ABN9TZ01_9DINO|nr:unnamed protein product [Polarella glacialis]
MASGVSMVSKSSPAVAAAARARAGRDASCRRESTDAARAPAAPGVARGPGQLELPVRLVEEALAQDEQQLQLEQLCAPGAGHEGHQFLQQGVLRDVQRVWRAFDSRLVLWSYANPRDPEVTEYLGVDQQIVSVTTATPKDFVSGVNYFLVLATPVEVSLHTLCFAPNSDRLLPIARTRHAVVTDDIVVGTIVCDDLTGRIFMGGSDGCIHEFQYFDDDVSWLGGQKPSRKRAVSWNLQSTLPTLLRKASEYIQPPAASKVTEPPLIQLCTISNTTLATQVQKARGQLFPGLAQVGARPGALSGLLGDAGFSPAGSAASPRPVARLIPLGQHDGGSVVACAVCEDGVRIFLRGNYKRAGAGGSLASAPTDGAGAQAGAKAQPPQMSSVAVHHVRFLDASAPQLRVRDAEQVDGILLLVAQIAGAPPAASPAAGRAWGAGGPGAAGAPQGGDVVVAIGPDARAVAQRQSRGHAAWLATPAGLVSNVDVVGVGGAGPCRVVSLAACGQRLPRGLQFLYGRRPGAAMVQPVAALSELARQQLLPPTRFLVVSNLGVHSATKIQPLQALQRHLLSGDTAQLRDFAARYTPEQTSALCFQLLASAAGAARSAPARDVGYREIGCPAVARDPQEEIVAQRAQHVLFSPQLARELGLSQAVASVDTRTLYPPAAAFGQFVQLRTACNASGRLRGLCLYLSRILRPMWLVPVMAVTWPPRAPGANRLKRKAGEWWPPAPASAPPVQGAQWRCTWSRAQRAHVHAQLAALLVTLEGCKAFFDPGSTATGLALSPGGAAPAALGAAVDPSAAPEASVAAGLMLLTSTAVEALLFLELVAGQADALSAAPCPPEVLVKFAELSLRDLVCQPEARQVLQQLMQGGVVACRQLHARCRREDLEVQEACELLAAVQGSLAAARGSGDLLDRARLGALVQRALRALLQHAARVDLARACGLLRAVGACKGLVALCAGVARARDPRDEALRAADPLSARVQQLHYARLECYQAILEVFEDVHACARKHQSSVAGAAGPALLSAGAAPGAPSELPELLPVPVADADAPLVLDALLRHCLEGQPRFADELFHFCVLKWMVQRDLPVYRYDSPYAKGFLEAYAQDQPELLCRYLQHRGRWSEACDAYVALARDPARAPEAHRQLVLLQAASLCAGMPGSGRRAEPIWRAAQEVLERQRQERQSVHAEILPPPAELLPG